MVWLSIVHSLPTSPVKTGFAPCERRRGYLHLRESKFRNMMEVLSLVAKHSMDFEGKTREEKLLVDNRAGEKSIAGSIVALGKFDALHIGHRALAVQGSKMGPPVILSFKGMAEVLQWEKRLPIVAPCDRKRIMFLWADVCGGTAPLEYQLEFAKVRSLSPHDFVERLAKELLVKGVVAGANYRFGYKAAGDASDLVHLCGKFGLEVLIVDPVMDDSTRIDNVAEGLEDSSGREKGQVSSTRVRKALAVGDMRRVTQLLGRNHRLLLCVDDCAAVTHTIFASLSSVLNQVPMDGTYSARVCLVPDLGSSISHALVDGHVRIGDKQVSVSLKEGSFRLDSSGRGGFLCIDLQDRNST